VATAIGPARRSTSAEIELTDVFFQREQYCFYNSEMKLLVFDRQAVLSACFVPQITER
jgi:hypothetical protein